MDSTVVGDNMSEMSVPYKESMSRPGTPSSVIPPRLPPYTSRTNSPLRTATPIGQQRVDDYFTPNRGNYRNVDTAPRYANADDGTSAYELNAMPQRSLYQQDVSDSTSLLYDHLGRARDPRDPQPNRGRFI
jgi:hypothetical protein